MNIRSRLVARRRISPMAVASALVALAVASSAAAAPSGFDTVRQIQEAAGASLSQAERDRRTARFIERARLRLGQAARQAGAARPEARSAAAPERRATRSSVAPAASPAPRRRPAGIGLARAEPAPSRAPAPRARPDLPELRIAARGPEIAPAVAPAPTPRSRPAPRRVAAETGVRRIERTAGRAVPRPSLTRTTPSTPAVTRLLGVVTPADTPRARARRTDRFIARERVRMAEARRSSPWTRALITLVGDASVLTPGSVLGGMRGYWGIARMRGF